jgi:hypothetical protein
VHRREPLGRERLPGADGAQESDIARTERIDARIELARRLRRRGRRIAEQRNGKAGQGAREAGADRAAADDDQVMAYRVYNAAP